MKFTLSGFPERYALPPRPSKGSPAVLDAHRQTHFLLADDLTLFERAMNLQIEAVAANQKRRDAHAAVLFAYWSRAFSHMADVCAAVCAGSYVSAPPLLRAACDCIAAQRALVAGGFGESDEWAAGAIEQSKERSALSIDLGRFGGASVLADDRTLGPLYRTMTELSMPHLGTTLLQAAPDTTLQRAPIEFAKGSFHLAWAELTLGWLIALAGAQLRTVTSAADVLKTDETLGGDIDHAIAAIDSALSAARRCYVEEIDGAVLIHNYRRTATGQPRRVIIRQ